MKKFLIFIIAVILVVVGVGAWYYYNNTGIGVVEVKIDNTANQITEIKKIGQWEFLNIQCEVLVDTVRPRSFIMTDDRLARIYKGSLRLGIDLQETGDNWIERHGDTLAVLNLPAIKLLDDRFIDEANTVAFYEDGKWDASAKEAMFKSAEVKMRKIALTPEYLEMARQQAQTRFESLFKALGFNETIVNFNN